MKPEDEGSALGATQAAIAQAKAAQARLAAVEREARYASHCKLRDARAARKKAATAAHLAERKRRNQREHRARKAAEEAARAAALPARVPAQLDRVALVRELIAFRAWLRQPGQRHAQLRRQGLFYWRARKALLRFRLDHGHDPRGAEFGRYLSDAMIQSFDRYQGARLLKQITSLEGNSVPWPAVTQNVRTLEKSGVSRRV